MTDAANDGMKQESKTANRRTGYVVRVILLTALLSIPYVAFAFACVWNYMQGRDPFPGLGGLQYVMTEFGTAQQFPSAIHSYIYWNGKFISFPVEHLNWKDAETGKSSLPPVALVNNHFQNLIVAGNRIWFVGANGSYEYIDNELKKCPFDLRAVSGGRMFALPIVWNDELIFVAQVTSQEEFDMIHFKDGNWEPFASITRPSTPQNETSSEAQKEFRYSRSLKCFNQGNHVHLFLKQDGYVFYRAGLKLKPNPDSAHDSSDLVTEAQDSDHGTGLDGWSLVLPERAKDDDFDVLGMIVDGHPTVLVINGILSGHPTGRFFRFDGTSWNEFASYEFPFGSLTFRADSANDGQRAYVALATSTGTMRTYTVEAAGIRETNLFSNASNSLPQRVALNVIGTPLIASAIALELAIVLGLGTWGLMWWLTKPDYSFGKQTVTLASLGWRGCARLIDLALIIFTTAALVTPMLDDFDWLSLFEALNLRADHPALDSARRVVSILIGWPVFVAIGMIVGQAAWGVTPGKWLCGLRTVRTSLRPCGFLSSLARELVFVVDCCGFLCWIPGIVTIALTEYRQRLGDLVADTVIVNRKSLQIDGGSGQGGCR